MEKEVHIDVPNVTQYQENNDGDLFHGDCGRIVNCCIYVVYTLLCLCRLQLFMLCII